MSNLSETERMALYHDAKLQNKMEKMSEQEILRGGGIRYIKVEDEFDILEEWNRKKI